MNNLKNWYETWKARGLTVTRLVGEWGYSERINVGDATQASVIQAEVNAFSTVPYLLRTNYWVGPGWEGDGGYTQIFTHASEQLEVPASRPEVSNPYASMTR